MSGPHKNFPLTQGEFQEQAAAIAYMPPQPPPAPGSNPFAPNPNLVRDE